MTCLIIAGSRSLKDYHFLKERLDFLTKDLYIDEVVSGTCHGSDKLGERWATDNNISIKQFPAQWDTLGRGAGLFRNEDMARYATHCIVFWDGESRGSKHMIDTAEKFGLKLRVVKYKL